MKNKCPIVVIDYGMGNIGSICNMYKYLGYQVDVTSDRSVISSAEKIILPGVGHFDKAIQNINRLGLYEIIRRKALVEKTYILGICLGMHIMCSASDEGSEPGLALVDAEVIAFKNHIKKNMKVPHMGWNGIVIAKNSRIMHNLDGDSKFYFVHSYYVNCKNEKDVLTHTDYGLKFVSSFQVGNIIGVQFHPEKSHKYGLNVLKNFAEI